MILALCSLFAGTTQVGVADLTAGHGWDLIWESRLPRTCAVLLTGASLAIAGQIMQLIARNRFVEPMTAGTGQSAMLGVLIVVFLLPGAPMALQMLAAASMALIGSLGFFAITRHLPPTQPLLVPLVGLIYGGVVGASATYVAFQTDLLQFLEIWLNGEFSGTIKGRYELLWFAGLAAALSYLVADQLSILSLGEDVSRSLGLNYRQVVIMGLVVVAVVTGLTVVTVGMIPFVGLVVPNLVSRAVGDNLRRSLPVTALAGAGLVLICDLFGRLIIHPFELPAATVVGIIGAAIFLWMLYGGRSHAA